MVEALTQTARWLASASPASPGPNPPLDSSACAQEIAEKIEQLNRGAVGYPDFVRWHLEDNLVRAALLRYLRLQGRGSRWRESSHNWATIWTNHPALRALIAATRTQQGDSWVPAAVAQVNRWASGDHESALARSCLLWFTGRQGQPDKIHSAIDETCRWLARNPNQTLVRWAATWSAGLPPEGEPTSRLIEDTAEWLEQGRPMTSAWSEWGSCGSWARGAARRKFAELSCRLPGGSKPTRKMISSGSHTSCFSSGAGERRKNTGGSLSRRDSGCATTRTPAGSRN